MLTKRHSGARRMLAGSLVFLSLVFFQVYFLQAAAFAWASKTEPTVEELKAKIAGASIVDRPPLCIQVSEIQLGAANRFYGMGDSTQAKGALGDMVAFSELARDYSIQSHKHEKQSEIAIRGMIRRLANLKHVVSHEEEADVQGVVDRMERVRDDLLTAMFPKAKGQKQ